MALLSEFAQRKKLEYFFSKIPKDARILEIGCADGWVGKWAVARGWKNFVGIDIIDGGYSYDHKFIHGDIAEFKKLGLKEKSFDVIIAFEVIEHGDFYGPMHDLLRPGGMLYVTTPVPHMDWACQILEKLHLNQTRSSKHTHLIYMKDVPKFKLEKQSIKAFISQWGEFSRPVAAEED